MSGINILEGPIAALREEEIHVLNDLATALAEIGDSAAEDRKRLLDVAQDLREMFFMVVVIGEFNSGKSSFVNALLQDSLLPMGITPTTEFIEVVRYQDTPVRKPVVRDDAIREWGHPNTGMPGVAIVDTPGTGSVFQKHETVAKSFLHRSDLVIFVISAKRAFAQTERLYLELAKNYGKKIILVINQIDLLEPAERAEVRRFIENQVKTLLNIEPLIFTVSAKEAMSGEEAGEEAGIDAVRAHLRGVYSEAPPAKQKLIAQLDTAARITKSYIETLKGKADLVSSDITKVRDVQQELQKQSAGLENQMREASAEIDKVLEGLRMRGMTFIDSNLSIRRIGRVPSREKLQAEFQEVVIGRALKDIQEAAGNYVNAVIDHSRLYWRGVIDRLNQLRELMEQELSGLDAGVYAEQRENIQNAIRIAETELKSYSSGQVISQMQENFSANMSGFQIGALATVGGVVAVLLAGAAPGPLLGAGALLTASLAFIIGAPVAVIGSYTMIRYFRRITRETKQAFHERVDSLVSSYHASLDELTRKERSRLTQYGQQVLTPVFSRLESLAQRYSEQQTQLKRFQDKIEDLRQKIEKGG